MGSWLLLSLIVDLSGLDKSVGSSGVVVIVSILIVVVECFCVFAQPLAWMLMLTLVRKTFWDANFVTKLQQFPPGKKTVKQKSG